MLWHEEMSKTMAAIANCTTTPHVDFSTSSESSLHSILFFFSLRPRYHLYLCIIFSATENEQICFL